MSTFTELHRWNKGEQGNQFVSLGYSDDHSLCFCVNVGGRQYFGNGEDVEGIPGAIKANRQALRSFLLSTDVEVSVRSNGQRAISILPKAKEFVVQGIGLDLTSFISGAAKTALEEAQQVRGHDVVMVVGNTDTGKSTLVNQLLGSELEVVGERFNTTVVVREGSREYAPIGHKKTESCTAITKNYKSEQGFFLSDGGGFLDTRGASTDALVALSTLFTIRASCSIRFIVCITYGSIYDDKGIRFREIMRSFFRLIGGDLSAIESVIFLVTKWPHSVSKDKVLGLVKEKIDEAVDGQEKKLYESIIREGGRYVHLYDPIAAKSREEVFTLLNSLSPIAGVRRGGIYSTHVENDLKDPVHRFCRRMSELYDSYRKRQEKIDSIKEKKAAVDRELKECVLQVDSLEPEIRQQRSLIVRQEKELADLTTKILTEEATLKDLEKQKKEHERTGNEEVCVYAPPPKERQMTTVKKETGWWFFKKVTYEKKENPLKETFLHSEHPVSRAIYIPPLGCGYWNITHEGKVFKAEFNGFLGNIPACELKLFAKKKDTEAFKKESERIEGLMTAQKKVLKGLTSMLLERQNQEGLKHRCEELERRLRANQEQKSRLELELKEADESLIRADQDLISVRESLHRLQPEIDSLKEFLDMLGESFKDKIIIDFIEKEQWYDSVTASGWQKAYRAGRRFAAYLAGIGGF